MEYTVQKLSRLAGVSPRTLRYYDHIGLLKPERLNEAGYRLYGRAEVDRLQQILFYRALDVSLETIGTIVNAPAFNALEALQEHREKLLAKRAKLDSLIANLDKTIAATEGRTKMTDLEKFEAFKQKSVDENEALYGKEIRAKYGNEVVDRSNGKVKGTSPEEYEEVTRLGAEVMDTLRAAFKTGDPSGELAQKAADLHSRWLMFYWDHYTKEAHTGVTQMYVDDERFRAFTTNTNPAWRSSCGMQSGFIPGNLNNVNSSEIWFH